MKYRLALTGTAAVALLAIVLFLVTRTTGAGAVRQPANDSRSAEANRTRSELVSPGGDSIDPAVRRIQVAEESSGEARTSADTSVETYVLRVILEGVSDEDAVTANVTVLGADESGSWPSRIKHAWPCQRATSELDLAPFLDAVAEARLDSPLVELRVVVETPFHLNEKVRLPLTSGVRQSGRTVYEVRVRPVRPDFWEGFTLNVRDAHTRAHLDEVELRFLPGAINGLPPSTFIADGLASPIALMGGHAPGEPGRVAGLALSPVAGETPRIVETFSHQAPKNGVIVSAWAPGYAWGSMVLDASKTGEHELLLQPGAVIDLRMTNVQLDRYDELRTDPTLCVYWIREDGGDQYVRFERIDETLRDEGIVLEGLAPGGYAIAVELRGDAFTKRPVLVREPVSLVTGETRELVLTLNDAPGPQERATLAGVVSFPAFEGEDDVQLELYEVGGTNRWKRAAELSLSEMERVGGALPTRAFRFDDLPVGLYQARLVPFMKSWMIELPSSGRDDVELSIPELAEVVVETVDARTGKRVPAIDLKYGTLEVLPDQVYARFGWADREGLGRFRFWAPPGAAYVQTNRMPHDYGWRRQELELTSGLQSVRFELQPACTIHFDFRIDGNAPRVSDGIAGWIRYAPMKSIRPVDHEARALSGDDDEQIVEVTAPGLYEIDFAGLTKDRFLPLPIRRVNVRSGEITEVIVELSRM